MSQRNTSGSNSSAKAEAEPRVLDARPAAGEIGRGRRRRGSRPPGPGTSRRSTVAAVAEPPVRPRASAGRARGAPCPPTSPGSSRSSAPAASSLQPALQERRAHDAVVTPDELRRAVTAFSTVSVEHERRRPRAACAASGRSGVASAADAAASSSPAGATVPRQQRDLAVEGDRLRRRRSSGRPRSGRAPASRPRSARGTRGRRCPRAARARRAAGPTARGTAASMPVGLVLEAVDAPRPRSGSTSTRARSFARTSSRPARDRLSRRRAASRGCTSSPSGRSRR